MKRALPITTLFVDVGGVLLTNGWDHHARRRAARRFNLNYAEMEDRHVLNFAAHEEGRVTFQEYLNRVVFYKKRSFTRAQFRAFMFTQSKPFTKMIALVRNLKARYGLRIAAVSNESREVNAHRIREFKLDGFVDTFISSCFVHAPARNVLYIENTPMFVQIAEAMGIRSILHKDYKSTCAKLASLGLLSDEKAAHNAR
jgi:putative hydrolase of the HAD superfamily